MSTEPVSRKARQDDRDKWLLSHADILTAVDLKIIAILMKDADLFSPETGNGDVRVHVANRCKQLGLKFKGHERK